MRPFAVFGVILVVFGILGIVFALFAYSTLGSDCVGVRGCTGAYPGWFELRVAIWGVFGFVLIIFGALLIWRASRPARFGRFGLGYGPRRFGGRGGYYGPRGGGWGNAGGGAGYGARFCTQCNTRNGPNFQFCRACGAPLGPPGGSAPLTPGPP